MKKRSLDIFEVLRQIDIKNRDYYDHPTEEEQIAFEKALQPYVIMRWLTGTTRNGLQIYLLNEYVNPYIFASSFLREHKRLLFYLLTVCTNTNKRPQRYKWIPNRKTTTHPKTVECLKQYLHYNATQARDAIPLLTVDDVVQYASDLGMQPDEIKAIRNEFK